MPANLACQRRVRVPGKQLEFFVHHTLRATRGTGLVPRRRSAPPAVEGFAGQRSDAERRVASQPTRKGGGCRPGDSLTLEGGCAHVHRVGPPPPTPPRRCPRAALRG